MPYTEFQLLSHHIADKNNRMSGKPGFSFQKQSHKDMISRLKEIEENKKK